MTLAVREMLGFETEAWFCAVFPLWAFRIVRKHPVLARLVMLVVAVVASAAAIGQAIGQSPAPPAAVLPPDKSEALQEVTVKAERLKLAQRARKFVNQIATLENEEGLARWNGPVCALVLGFSPEENEWILGRVAHIARVAKVPFIADERCRPKNLFIFANGDPKRLLQNWDDRNSTRLQVFGSATPMVVNEFIAIPDAVRVWHNAGTQTAAGLAIASSVNYGSKYASTGGIPWISMTPLEASHLSSNVVYTFSSVFVIADVAQLHGVSLGQFADYVAMVGLADIKPGAHTGDAPTILKLFDGAPQTAPAGATDWDLAFLKSLYTTEQKSKLQRRLIANGMVRELAH